MPASDRVVIIGACYAGLAVAADLRAGGHEGEIRILDSEPKAGYHRTHLSKECLSGAMPPPAPLHAPAWFADQRIGMWRGMRVEAIDRTRHVIVTGQGDEQPYDRLILTTGARARSLPVQVDPEARALTLRTAVDAATLADRMRDARRVAIIGGGLIGLEAAAAFRAFGLEVVVIEAAAALMARCCHLALSDRVRDRHLAAGIDFRLGAGVAQVTGAGVALQDGAEVAADLVLAAIGSVPRTRLAAAAGLSCPDGVAVDAHGRTADPRVLALGDCALWEALRHESVAAARAQALRIAAGLQGRPAPVAGPLRLWSTQGDLRVQMTGPVPAGAEVEVSGAERGVVLRAVQAGRVVAVQALDAPRAFAAALAEVDAAEREILRA